jgi:beta-galactosidase
MDGVILMTRQNDRNHAGDIREFAIAVSDDGAAWHEVSRGELESTFEPQTVRFAGTVTSRWLRFTALSGFGNDTTTALADLAVLYAGPKLVAADQGEAEYHRLRSTSGDIIESGPAAAPSGASLHP